MAMQPQTSLLGANAGTAVPQSMQAPRQLNPNAMNTQIQQSQQRGMPTSQAVNMAANNPNNRTFAKGGLVNPPSKQELDTKLASEKLNSSDLAAATKAIEGETAIKPMQNGVSSTEKAQNDSTEDMFKSYFDKKGQDYLKDRSKMTEPTENMAKGGQVSKQSKDMSLKDIVKMLAAHPEVAGSDSSAGIPMKKGGKVGIANMKSEARTNTSTDLSMNDDTGTYAKGGIIKMSSGGSTEADNIKGYSPDGSPIIENADGSEQNGNINDLLGRPSNAPTMGTGIDPNNATSQNASNAIGGNSMQAMAKGGAEAPPPGSLSEEVADDVSAKLSEGEFVFSADSTRYYGLRMLTALQNHAREELAEMEKQGNIRSPNDGKNPVDNGGQFMQDQKPNMDAYSNEDTTKDNDNGMDDEISGLLKECKGGSVGMNDGGAVDGEEQSLARGGIVSSTAPNLNVKKSENLILSGKGKIPGVKNAFSGTNKLPKMRKGGLLKDYNGAINSATHQSYTGS